MDAQKKSILLIDDDTSLLRTLSDFLKFEGYHVMTADCGEAGLEVLEDAQPDLIILDMSMPGMGGIGFLKEVSSTTGTPRYPVLVLTARANMAEFFANVDVAGFIAKPCDPNDLLMEVARIIFLTSGGGTQDAGTARKERRKVLVGEDDDLLRNRLVAALGEAGFLVDSVAKGPDMLEQAIVQRPHLIIVKKVFPGMNGDTLAEMLKEMPNTKAIPVILYDDTGDTGSAEKYTAGKARVARYLKTSDIGTLVKAAGEVL